MRVIVPYTIFYASYSYTPRRTAKFLRSRIHHPPLRAIRSQTYPVLPPKRLARAQVLGAHPIQTHSLAHLWRPLAPISPEAQPPLADLLRVQMLPAADVERISALFASHGVGEGAYVRVFARMISRDAWLRELRERGLLSEMQFFVVRDVFDRVAAADE
ncbi:hypothetical protein VTO73DRAFT_7734 [Trametes versicolor]